MEADVRSAFVEQARHCDRLGSPFTALLCRLVAERLDASTALGTRILGWADDPGPRRDVLPLRLAGGLHALVRAGRSPDLAVFYPPTMPTADALWQALSATFQTAGDALMPWLDGPPQTNEVARSALLWTGLLHVAAVFGPRVSLFELGASAGLNLVLDAYAYDLGGLRTGDPESPLRLMPDWQGPAPPSVRPVVVARGGVDVNPLSVTRDEDRARLAAYIWADQRTRLDRIESAITIAARQPPQVDRADAADWLDARLGESPAHGVTRVVLHSIAFQYFPAETRRRIVEALAASGARASLNSPLAWLRFENDPNGLLGADLRLTLWPGGAEHRLAEADPHGRRVVALPSNAAMPRA